MAKDRSKDVKRSVGSHEKMMGALGRAAGWSTGVEQKHVSVLDDDWGARKYGADIIEMRENAAAREAEHEASKE